MLPSMTRPSIGTVGGRATGMVGAFIPLMLLETETVCSSKCSRIAPILFWASRRAIGSPSTEMIICMRAMGYIQYWWVRNAYILLLCEPLSIKSAPSMRMARVLSPAGLRERCGRSWPIASGRTPVSPDRTGGEPARHLSCSTAPVGRLA